MDGSGYGHKSINTKRKNMRFISILMSHFCFCNSLSCVLQSSYYTNFRLNFIFSFVVHWFIPSHSTVRGRNHSGHLPESYIGLKTECCKYAAYVCHWEWWQNFLLQCLLYKFRFGVEKNCHIFTDSLNSLTFH